MKQKKVRRHMHPRGVAVLMLLGIILYLLGYSVVKNTMQEAADPSAGIETDGTFAANYDDTTEPPTEAPPQATTDPLEGAQSADYPGLNGTWVPEGFVTVERDVAAQHSGKLLRLDSAHKYTGYEGEYTTFMDGKNDCYRVRLAELEIQECVVDAMNRLAQAYEMMTDEANLMIYSTTSACAANGSIYPDELPDRATGYCVDFVYRNEDTSMSPMYEGDKWLINNAYSYGFVLDYTEAEEEATGIPAAPYHLRYVGKVHSMLMHDNEWTFSQYLTAVKNYSTESPLTYTDGNRQYSVYYVPATLGVTYVPVPKNGKYEVSGDNDGGFIVTAWEDLG